MKLLNNIINNVRELPTLPTIYWELNEILENPNSTAADAGNVISKDQSTVSKILKVANSAVYGIRGKIDTVSQAIFHIGFEEVRNLVMAMSVIDVFKNNKVLEVINPVDLWKHSIAVGVVSRLLAREMGIGKLENYFIGGILHDIGKIFFLRYFSIDFAQAVSIAQERKISMKEAEREIFGISHTAVGELIVDQWRLPTCFKNVIANHESGIVRDGFDSLTAVVHISNITAKLFELGWSGDNIINEPSHGIIEKLNLPNNTFTSLQKQILIGYQEAVSIFMLN